MTQPIFVAEGVSKSFGGVKAVDRANLSLHPARISGLIGPNGAGKSTLVDLLSGQQRSDAGRITLDGRDVTRLSAYRFARYGIARTFQTSRLTNNLTVRQALSGVAMSSRHVPAWRSVFAPKRVAEIRRIVGSTLRRVGLEHALKQYVRDLGWEQQRRLEIARALVVDCRVLLLDEPTAGMHAESLPRFSALIRAIADSGVSVLLIEHNVAFIRSAADDLYAMDSGSIITYGSVDDVLADERVVASYLGSVQQ